MPYADDGPVKLSYREFGKHHEGSPVLGIMGFALDARFWAGQVPAVAQSHRFITFDNRGVGRSSGPPITSIADMARDALTVLDSLEIERAVVFGESMGGAVAQQLALEHPDRVDALILAVTWARPIEFMRRQHQIARFTVTQGDPAMLTEISLVRMFTPGFFEMGSDAIDRMVESFTAQGGPDLPGKEILLAQIDAIDAHDVLDRLGEISCPTLVLGGKQDMMVPAFASEEIARAIPEARLQMFETGHACMIEEMQPFNDEVSAFLSALG
jgi:pimeloyl-ACP methyl ester carboxylesterase